VFAGGARGEQGDLEAGQQRARAQHLHHLVAVHAGHFQVEQEEVGVGGQRPRDADALLIVGSPNFHPGLLDDLAALRLRHGAAVRVLLWHLEHLPDLDAPAPALWAQALKSWADARRHGGRHGNSRAGNFLTIRDGARRGLFDRVFVFTARKAAFLRRQGIAAGDPVRVAAIEGLILDVEPLVGAARDYRERKPKADGAPASTDG